MVRSVFVLLALVCLAMPAWPEYYRYTDENGVTVFTDDPGAIPGAQRPKAQRVEGEVSADTQRVFIQEKEKSKDNEPSLIDDGRLDSIAALQEEKRSLDQIYLELTQRRNALKKAEAEGLKPGQESILHKKKADALNADIAAFDKRRKAYEARVSLFNANQ
jgi:nitroimidazol reductase NimA-like FMN-containing flavoprotein (pyridoxamine 5'-phosphate oxidase superfamily)